jgi:hypothetical protein
MQAAIDTAILKRVISQHLNCVGRNQMARDNAIGQGTVSNIIGEFKKGVENADYESVLEVAAHCKRQGICLSELAQVVKINNYIKQLGAMEDRVEQLISMCVAQDPKKIIEVLEKIAPILSGVPLEKLEENIRQRQTELLSLQQEISEARATIENVDVEKRVIEEYKKLKVEMDNLQLEEPKKMTNVFRSFKKYGYDVKKIIKGCVDIQIAEKQKREIEKQKFQLEQKIKQFQLVLPLAEQIALFRITIDELLAFHNAVLEKAEAQRIPPETAAYKVIEEIKQLSVLGGLIKQQERVKQQICMLNIFTGNCQAAINALCRLQLQGVTEEQILNLDRHLQQQREQRQRVMLH